MKDIGYSPLVPQSLGEWFPSSYAHSITSHLRPKAVLFQVTGSDKIT